MTHSEHRGRHDPSYTIVDITKQQAGVKMTNATTDAIPVATTQDSCGPFPAGRYSVLNPGYQGDLVVVSCDPAPIHPMSYGFGAIFSGSATDGGDQCNHTVRWAGQSDTFTATSSDLVKMGVQRKTRRAK